MTTPKLLAIAAVCFSCAGPSAAAPAIQLLTNQGFERGSDPAGVPVGWRTYVPNESAAIGADASIRHGGTHSASIETTSDLAAFLVSDPPVPVAPGEVLSLSVWCRSAGLRTSTGGFVAFSVGFQDVSGGYFDWHRTQHPIPAAGEWTCLQTTATVPGRGATATFQFGMRNLTGKLWMDDALFETAAPVAASIRTPHGTAEPGLTSIPAVLWNRQGTAGAKGVVVEGEPGAERAEIKSLASGATTVPLQFNLSKRGKNVLKVRVKELEGGEVLCETSATVTVPPLLVSEPLVPTHFCRDEGAKPKFDARVWIHAPEAERKEMELSCVLRDSSGTEVARWQKKDLPPNPVGFTIEVPKEKLDSSSGFVLEETVLHDGKSVASGKQDWTIINRAQAKVELGSDGYLVVDGKRFFPVGLYMGGNASEVAAAGFNATQTYGIFATLPGENPGNEAVETFLDNAHAAGIKALTFISHGLQARMGPEESLRRIRMFKNHPGVLIWNHEEAVARGIRPLSYLQDLYDTCKREAPEHPFLTGDTNDMSPKIKDRSRMFPEEAMDIATWWWYPVPPRSAENTEGYEGEPAGSDLEYVPPTFLTLARTKKPLWVALQCYKKPGATDGRFPTPDEYRVQAYIAVIHGAKGLWYYTGHGERGNGVRNKPVEGHWEELKKVVRELREMSPVFMSADAEGSVSLEPQSTKISTRMKLWNGKRVLLAANRTCRSLRVTMKVPGGAGGGGTGKQEGATAVKYENRNVELKAGAFADEFGPYAVHIYEMP